MATDNELNKPLGMAPQGKRPRRAVPTAMIVAGLLMLAALPVVHFYDGFSFLGQLSDEAVVNPKTPEPVQQVKNEPKPEKKPEVKAARIREVDESAGTLQELESDGEIVEPKLIPRPTKAVRQKQILAHLPDPELIERGATGVIPKRSPDGLRPMDVYSRQPDTEGNFGVARVVIIVAGLGISQTSTQLAIKELPGSITLAFAPYGHSLGRWMQQARKSGHELLLQVPMEPIDLARNNPGAHTLKNDATREENLADLHWSMSRITNYVGIMNYLGGRFLSEPGAIQAVFGEIAERGLLFLEDGSVKNSIGAGMAVRSILPYAKADVLLDNVRSRAAIAKKLDKLTKQAKRTGLAIGVGNAFPDTISMIAEFSRNAAEMGIEITPLAAIVKPSQDN